MVLNALIGKKSYQKQGFLQDGTRVPLTGVVVAGNVITQIKTQDKEGYDSIQLGIDAKKKFNKAIQGHADKALKSTPKETTTEKSSKKDEAPKTTPKYFREVRIEDVSDAILGSQVEVSEVFVAGDIIDVTGISKGKGWAGGVKRWGFHGGPRTHGQSDRERAPGSIGQTTTPGRVYKGKKMAGRMGSDRVTVKNLEIIEITNDGVLLIKGLVPGRVNSLLMVKKVGENKKFVPLYKEITEELIVEAPADVQKSNDEKGVSSQTISGDAQPTAEEKQNSDEASLSGDLASNLDEKPKEEEPTASSPEDGSAPAATTSNEKLDIKEETK